MVERLYRKLSGMNLEFVSGRLEENSSEKAIGYVVVFRMNLDFLNFKVMADQFIPGYLNHPVNAIRPELDGMAYHYAYNYFFDSAGKITNNPTLFKVFTHPEFYMDQWSSGGLEKRYAKPHFEVVDGQLQITARTDFRWGDGREIRIADLPLIYFQWALNLLESDVEFPEFKSPETKVVLGYAHEDSVEVEGVQLLRGTLYMIGAQLEFGEIPPQRILTAQ